MLQEFDLNIKDKKRTENLVVDHLSRLEGPINEVQINENFSDEKLLAMPKVSPVPWFVDYVNYLVAKVIPPEFTYQQKKKLFSELRHYYWEEPILYRHCAFQVIRRCALEEEIGSILAQCHSPKYGGHFGGNRTAVKVLQSSFY